MNVCLAELFSAYAPFTLRTAARFHGNGCQEGWLAVFFCQIIHFQECAGAECAPYASVVHSVNGALFRTKNQCNISVCKVPYITVRAVSSLLVAGAKIALSVHTWLTKHKEGPQITSFSCLFLTFSLCTHGKCHAIFASTTGRLETPITALYWISGENYLSITKRYDTRCYFNVRSKADISQLNLPHGTDN